MNRLLLLILCLGVSRTALAQTPYTSHHENVLGTQLELRVQATSPAAAKAAEKAALAEIDRLTAIYSTYDAKSEFRKWWDGENAVHTPSPELLALLKLEDEARDKSAGVFDPRIATAIQVWKTAAAARRIPTPDELQPALAAVSQPAWSIDGAKGTLTRLQKVPLTFDGNAKGLIVDKVCERMLKVDGVTGALVNIGGDLRLGGDIRNHEVVISDPRSPEKPLLTAILTEGGMATSGNYRRGFLIGDKWYSHILDPRTAQPVDHVISSTVIGHTLGEADGWATVFSVLPVEKSLELCKVHHLEALLITSDGAQHRTAGFPEKKEPQIITKPRGPNDWNTGAELEVNFEIARAEGGGRYRRPYMAVWVENAEEKSVRTLVLWLQTTGPGPRWHRDLKRWFKQDTARRTMSELNLIGTISAATKPPGIYKAVWDGKDDEGQWVPKGTYKLYIETAREHGTYQIQNKEVVIGEEAVTGELGTTVEFKDVKFSYRPRGATP